MDLSIATGLYEIQTVLNITCIDVNLRRCGRCVCVCVCLCARASASFANVSATCLCIGFVTIRKLLHFLHKSFAYVFYF